MLDKQESARSATKKMNSLNLPGAIYSLALAVLAWLFEYLTQNGTGIPWAPIAIAVIPMAIKAITVQVSPPAVPMGAARGLGEAQPVASKMTKFLLG